jgi:hypothetical protein
MSPYGLAPSRPPVQRVPPSAPITRRSSRGWIDHVREGLERYDAGELDAFELDELIHRYKRATQKLWTFCTGGGAHVYSTARTLQWLRDQGELPDWWEQATPRRARR